MARNSNNSLEMTLKKLAFSSSKRADFYREIKDYHDSGTPIYQIVITLYAEYKRYYKKSFLIDMLKDVGHSMKSGERFSESLRPWVSREEFTILTASESRGVLSDGLQLVIKTMETKSKLYTSLIVGVLKPFMFLGLTYALSMFMGKVLVPKLFGGKDVSLMPPAMQQMNSLAEFSTTYLDWMVLIVSVALGLIMFTLPSFTGSLRTSFDRFPPWSLYRSIQTSMFLSILASFLRAGIPFKEALDSIKKTSSPYLAWHIQKMLVKMAHGEGGGSALNTGLLTTDIAIKMAVYAKSGEFEAVMYRLSDKAFESAVNRVNFAMRMLNIIAMAAFGWVLAVMFMGIFSFREFVQSNLN